MILGLEGPNLDWRCPTPVKILKWLDVCVYFGWLYGVLDRGLIRCQVQAWQGEGLEGRAQQASIDRKNVHLDDLLDLY